MTERLPFLLSIPHAGTECPRELADRIVIDDYDVLFDGDMFADQIYDLGGSAEETVIAECARIFIDVNRASWDLPPANPDGAIKSMTYHKNPVYADGLAPDEALQGRLMAAYHEPYHRSIRKALNNGNLKVGLDCHSMLSAAPAISPDREGRPRPLFCLSNRDGASCTQEMMEILAGCMSESFGIGLDDIRLNDPFMGGYITTTYGNRPIPWIQIEVNRSLYMHPRWLDHRTIVNQGRLRDLNEMFHNAMRSFAGRLD